MKVIIDRFEAEYAVCEKEDKTTIDIPRLRLPKSAKSGDVLNVEDNEVTIDIEETNSRKKLIEEKTRNIWK